MVGIMTVPPMMTKPNGPSTAGHGLHGRPPADVACQGHQRPLATRRLQASEQELAEAHHAFNDPEHRLDGLLAQGIPGASGARLQEVLHACDRLGRQGQRRWLAEARLPGQMMRLATHRQQRLDADIDAGADVGRATVTGIGEQASDFAQQIGQRLQRGEERRDLLLVIGGLREPVATTSRVATSTAACAL